MLLVTFKNKMMKQNKYVVDNQSNSFEYGVRLREDNSLLHEGSMQECYAFIKLLEGGYF